jgi:putative AlgH/UPF0301 family transcriptional regulator
MFRNLADLKQRVNDLIATYGEDHYVAAWVFTDADVFTLDEDFNEEYLPEDDAQEVLQQVGNSDWVYGQINDFIEDEIKRLMYKPKQR